MGGVAARVKADGFRDEQTRPTFREAPAQSLEFIGKTAADGSLIHIGFFTFLSSF